MSHSIFIHFFIYIFGHAYSMQKFLGQGIEPAPQQKLSHCNDHVGSLTHWGYTMENIIHVYFYKSYLIKTIRDKSVGQQN